MKITKKIYLMCPHCGWVYDPAKHDGNYLAVPYHEIRGDDGKPVACEGEFKRPRHPKDKQPLGMQQ